MTDLQDHVNMRWTHGVLAHKSVFYHDVVVCYPGYLQPFFIRRRTGDGGEIKDT